MANCSFYKMTQIAKMNSLPPQGSSFEERSASSSQRLVPLSTKYYSPKSQFEVPGWRLVSCSSETSLAPLTFRPFTVTSKAQLTSQPRYPHEKMKRNVSLPDYMKGPSKRGLLKVPVPTSIGEIALPEVSEPPSSPIKVFLPPLRRVDNRASHHDHPAPSTESLRLLSDTDVLKPSLSIARQPKPVRVHSDKRPSKFLEVAEGRPVLFHAVSKFPPPTSSSNSSPIEETTLYSLSSKPVIAPERLIRKVKGQSRGRTRGDHAGASTEFSDPSFLPDQQPAVGQSDESMFNISQQEPIETSFAVGESHPQPEFDETSLKGQSGKERKWASVSTIENTTLGVGGEERQQGESIPHVEKSEIFSMGEGRMSQGMQAGEEFGEVTPMYALDGSVTPAFNTIYEVSTPQFTQGGPEESESLTSEDENRSLIEHEEADPRLNLSLHNNGSFMGMLSTNSTLETRMIELTGRSGGDEFDRETSREKKGEGDDDLESRGLIYIQGPKDPRISSRISKTSIPKTVVQNNHRKSTTYIAKTSTDIPSPSRVPDSPKADSEPDTNTRDSHGEQREYPIIEELEEQSEKSSSQITPDDTGMSPLLGSQGLLRSPSFSEDEEEDLDQPHNLGIPVVPSYPLRRSISNVDPSSHQLPKEDKSTEEAPVNKSDIVADNKEVEKEIEKREVMKKKQKLSRKKKKRSGVSISKNTKKKQVVKPIPSAEKSRTKMVAAISTVPTVELFPSSDNSPKNAPTAASVVKSPRLEASNPKPSRLEPSSRVPRRDSFENKSEARSDTRSDIRPEAPMQNPVKQTNSITRRKSMQIGAQTAKQVMAAEGQLSRRRSSAWRVIDEDGEEIDSFAIEDEAPRVERKEPTKLVVATKPVIPPIEADEVFTRHFSFSLLKMILSIQVKYAETSDEVNEARKNLEAARMKVLMINYHQGQGLQRQASVPTKGEMGMNSPSSKQGKGKKNARKGPRKSITSRSGNLNTKQRKSRIDLSDEEDCEEYDELAMMSNRERMYMLARSRTDFELKHLSMLKSLALNLLASKEADSLYPQRKDSIVEEEPQDPPLPKKKKIWFEGECDELPDDVQHSLASIFHDFKPIPITAFTSVVTNFFKDPQSAKNAAEVMEATEELDLKNYHDSLESRKFLEYMRMMPSSYKTPSGVLHQTEHERFAPSEFSEFFRGLFVKRRKRNKVMQARGGTVPATIRAKPTFTETNLNTKYYNQAMMALQPKRAKAQTSCDVILSGGAHLVKDADEYRERVYCRMKNESNLKKFTLVGKNSRIHTASLSCLTSA